MSDDFLNFGSENDQLLNEILIDDAINLEKNKNVNEDVEMMFDNDDNETEEVRKKKKKRIDK